MNRSYRARVATLALCLSPLGACTHQPPVDGVSIASLAARDYRATLNLEEHLRDTLEHQASLVSFDADGLHQYALLLQPLTPPPPEGYPVVVFGHGFHPEPRKHGISAATGDDWRPGDYYRGVPERYARAGFLVLAPDYRGHNKSEGYAFTRKGPLATSYYASDVLHLLAAVQTLAQANAERVFFVGHSMGGEIGLKVLLATDRVRAASLWAPVAASSREQVLNYSPTSVDPLSFDAALADLKREYAALEGSVTFADVDPLGYIEQLHTPVVVHHARRDGSVPHAWSQALVALLHAANKDFAFFRYDSDEHLLLGADREQAVQRDLAFFADH